MNANPEKLRSFIGISPTAEFHAFLQSFKQHHSKDFWVRHIRWTAETNIHLTMRFLGDLTRAQIEQILAGLEPIANNQAAFYVSVGTPQPFPSHKKARILAAPVQKHPDLEQLAKTIDALAINAGVPEEDRPFRGHLTIGRFRSPMKHLDELLREAATVSVPVDHVTLFTSVLKPTGAEYHPQGKFPFKYSEPA